MCPDVRASGPVDILIAEDDAATRGSLRAVLELEGYTCAEAGNGLEAVEQARLRAPQCVFLDLVMPELDGLGAARRLRSDPLTRGAHIHCLTGRVDEDVQAQAYRAGCELFLTKPVDVATLLQIVQEQVQRTRTRIVSGLTKAQAEELLDWLDATGRGPGELVDGDKMGFTVRYHAVEHTGAEPANRGPDSSPGTSS